MKTHNLVQKSEAWKSWRKDGITASMLPVIMKVSPYQKIDELYLQMIGETPETEQNYAMSKGSFLEPLIKTEVERLYGEVFIPLCISHDKYDWARASLDGYFPHPKSSIILEIKYNNKETHELVKMKIIPEAHRPQIQWQMFVAECDECAYVSSNGSPTDIEIVEVKADKDYQAKLFGMAQWFWNCVITRTSPTDPLSDDLIFILKKYEKLAILSKKIEEKMDELKGIIKDITPPDKSIAYGRISGAWRSRQGAIDYSKIDIIKEMNLDVYRKPPIQYFDLRLSRE